MFLFGFRKFIAPIVIKILYYLGLVAIVFGGLGVIIYAMTEMSGLGARLSMQMIIGALIGAPILILILRFMTEMWLVLFEMNDRLAQIRDKR
jgi:hypothetical protein